MQYERFTGIAIMIVLLVLSRFGIYPIGFLVNLILDVMGTVIALPLNFLLNLILA